MGCQVLLYYTILKKMTPKQKEIYKQIDLILWPDWDPIGINDIESARDEYYNYSYI